MSLRSEQSEPQPQLSADDAVPAAPLELTEQQAEYKLLFNSLSREEKRVILVFPIVKAAGERFAFIAAALGNQVPNLQEVLSSLVEKGHLLYENDLYKAVDPQFIKYIETTVAQW